MSRKFHDVCAQGKKALIGAGVPDADIDANLLLMHVCDVDKQTILMQPDYEVTEECYLRYVNYIERRKKREPLQQITGEQDFMGLKFYVNQEVLCPRYDTEVLVEEVMRHLHDGMRILDVCTGSGCILLSLLHYSNGCEGVGVDLSKEALIVAKSNACSLGIEATFLESDLFEQVSGKFDIIVSNPPYIRSDVIETLMPEVRDYEPRMALDGMEDGLHFYREIIRQCKDFMGIGSKLFFEIGYDQGQDVLRLMQEAGFTECSIVKDFAGLDRVVYGTYCGR